MQHELVQRKRLLGELALRSGESPVTVLLGARQVGKTTLARLFCGGCGDVAWYDLETSSGMASLRTLPEKTLGGKRGLVVLGVSPATARHYLDILCGSYVMRQLQPWLENLGKRQVKSPKLYFRDSGLLHFFLGTEDMDGLQAHPRLGAPSGGVGVLCACLQG